MVNPVYLFVLPYIYAVVYIYSVVYLLFRGDKEVCELYLP